jgi:naphthalene 1,2-dioxygenase system ferredoxin subunit
MSDTKHWINVAAEADLRPDDVIGVEAAGRDIALYRVEGQVYATDNLCSHGYARLCDGFLLDFEIECPLHQGRFDIRTGQAMCAPLTEDIARWPVRIEGGRVWVELPAGT